jgi:PhnB protein
MRTDKNTLRSSLQFPKEHQSVMPYLIVKGADELIEFLKKVFDAEDQGRVLRAEGMILHAEVNIYGSTVMIAETSQRYPVINSGIFIYVPDTDATYERALDLGATSVMEPQNTKYAHRGAGIRDPFGNTWWLATIK